MSSKSEKQGIEEKVYLLPIEEWKKTQTEVPTDPTGIPSIDSSELLKRTQLYKSQDTSDPLNYKLDQYKIDKVKKMEGPDAEKILAK